MMIDYSKQYRLEHIRYKLEHTNILDMDVVPSDWQNLFTEDIFREYKDKVVWKSALRHVQFSNDFLRELIQENIISKSIIQHELSTYQKLDCKFIDEFADQLNWIFLSAHQHLTEYIIEKYQNVVDWTFVSRYQNLSNIFLEKYEDKVIWPLVARYQRNVDGYLIHKHRDKLSHSEYMFGMRK